MHVTPASFLPASYGEVAVYLGPQLTEAQRKASDKLKEEVHDAFQRICSTGRDAIWHEAEADADLLLAGGCGLRRLGDGKSTHCLPSMHPR